MKESIYDPDSPHDPVAPRQVSPNPQSDLDAAVDRIQAVREAIKAHPDAGADEIVALLAAQQIEVSGTLVMQEMMHLRQTNRHAPR
jgi:hypothetical protein